MADLCDAVDCGRPAAPAAARAVPTLDQPIDYMARDFDSLLRAMFDLLPARVPGWRDRTEADLGMAIVEAFAFLGDQLAYAQDRVAGEAFLRSAELYDSVRRHLALVGYRLDPGRAARATLAFSVSAPRDLAAGFAVRTAAVAPGAPIVFETSRAALLHPELNAIALAADAPGPGGEVVLVGDLGDTLAPDAWLFFGHDTQGEWAQVGGPVSVSGGLPVTTTVTLRTPLAGVHVAGSLVRGNGVPATHGESHAVEARGTGAPRQRLALDFAPLTYTADDDGRPVSSLRVLVNGERWVEVEDFVGSAASDPHYRVSRDDDGVVAVEFGDGRRGLRPAAGAPLAIRHRSGVGESGLVAAGTLVRHDDPDGVIDAVVNPLPSHDAREPESPEHAKLAGPARVRVQERAVTAEDFERILLEGVRVDGALVRPLHVRATPRATGSWTTTVVSVEMPDRAPLPAPPAPSPVRDALLAALDRIRLAGADVRLESARHAALHIALVVHVRPEFFARHVRAGVQRALGTDTDGFFAPRRFGFGRDVYLSDLYAAVTAVEGVQSLAVTRFKRLGDRYPDREAAGFIPVDALELARCDSDGVHPEHGVLFIRTCGGQDG